MRHMYTLEIYGLPPFTYLDGLECLPAILLFFVTRLLFSGEEVSSCIGLEVIGSLKVKDTIISSIGISWGNRLWISICSSKFEPGVTWTGVDKFKIFMPTNCSAFTNVVWSENIAKTILAQSKIIYILGQIFICIVLIKLVTDRVPTRNQIYRYTWNINRKNGFLKVTKDPFKNFLPKNEEKPCCATFL